MANGKQIRRPKETKAWKILNGTYKKPIDKEDVEFLIAGIQQECQWTERDVETFDAINSGKIDWSGNARSKRRTRKHIRKRG
jgi:hypothetical protein